MPNDSFLDRLAAQQFAAALREESLYAAIERGDFDGKTVTFNRYEDSMPDDSKLTVVDIERVVQAIRDDEVHYQDGDWLVTINPMHLATPWSRGRLWQAIERLVELSASVAAQEKEGGGSR